MTIARRDMLAGATALAAVGVTGAAQGATPMYGLIGKMLATPGARDAVIAAMLESTEAMPGCLSYIVAKDPANADAIWVTEVWDNAESHKASLKLPAVQAAIAKAKPMIAGFGEYFETNPVGGFGLAR